MSASGSIWGPGGYDGGAGDGDDHGGATGWTVRHVSETGSTNADLLAALDEGLASHRHVLVADYQTSGRGRLDRTWEAPAGSNLLVSLAFTHVPEVAATLTQRVGLAVVEGVRTHLPDAPVSLKWPNDVLLDSQKLAGILAQRSGRSGAVVVGVGVNVGWAPEGAAKLGDGIPVPALLTSILLAFDALPPDCSDRYRADLGTIGREVRVELPGGDPEPNLLLGRAIDVDATGRLVVEEPDGTVHHLDVGDVVHATALPGD